MSLLGDMWKQAGNYAESARCEAREAAMNEQRRVLQNARYARSLARRERRAGVIAIATANREARQAAVKAEIHAARLARIESERYNCTDCGAYGYALDTLVMCEKCHGSGKQSERRQ